MKLLCLHGYGTSTSILEQQMSGLIGALGEHNEYVFIEGETVVAPSPLVGMFASDRHRSYWKNWLGSDVQKAHDLITDAIDEAGEEKFDGILGFSQGGALVMSYLMHHQVSQPNTPPPFNFAIILSSNLVLSPDPEYKTESLRRFLPKFSKAEMHAFHEGLEIGTEYIQVDDFESFKTLNPDEQELASRIMGTTRYMIEVHDILKIEEGVRLLPENSVWTDFPRFYHPAHTKERVTIPTVHVVGTGDSVGMRYLANLAKQLCAGDTFYIEYDGIHDVPRKPADVDRVVSAIEKAHYLGQRQAMVF